MRKNASDGSRGGVARPRRVVGILGFLLAAHAGGGIAVADPMGGGGLWGAVSADGLAFGGERALFAYAGSPSVAVLSDGTLVLVAEMAGGDSDPEAPMLASARSSDGGRTWTALAPLRVEGKTQGALRGRCPRLVVTEGGIVRLYYIQQAADRAGRRSASRTHEAVEVLAAVSRDGLGWTSEPGAVIRTLVAGRPRLTALYMDEHIYLWLSGESSGKSGRNAHGIGRQFASLDGRSFQAQGLLALPDRAVLHAMIEVDGRPRAIARSENGAISFGIRDGRNWRVERGARIPRGDDYAVARRSDGSYLMVYAVASGERESGVVSAGDHGHDPDRGGAYGDDAAGVDTVVASSTWEVAGDADIGDASDDPPLVVAGADGGATGDDRSAGAESAPQVGGSTPGPADGGLPAGRHGAGGADGEAGMAERDGVLDGDVEVVPEAVRVYYEFAGLGEWRPDDTDGYAPPPNFAYKVSYLDWYHSHFLRVVVPNAADAYNALLPAPWGGTADAEQVRFEDMHHDPNWEDGPAPWDPADHPAWEQSRLRNADLISRFRDASLIEEYVSNMLPTSQMAADEEGEEESPDPDRDELLLNLMLPHLSTIRTLGKATLAESWRVDEEGRVNTDRMVEAWETVLRSATHMQKGATLIEELVGVATQSLTHRHALAALEHDVFSSPEQLEQALDTLRTFDRKDRDSRLALRGEHAFMMDTLQYMFSPPAPEGGPQVNHERVKEVSSWFMGPEEGAPPPFEGLVAEDVYGAIDAQNEYFRELEAAFRTGYPEVRSGDIDALTQKYMDKSPVTRGLIPSLSRYHFLETRAEASRRATQLSYEVHLFQARQGRWPASLDELPAVPGSQSRIDPFSGSYFGYQLTPEGPKIYSASENGIDDGGVHSARWRVEESTGGSDDYVFWPPQ